MRYSGSMKEQVEAEGGKVEGGGGAFLCSRNYWKFPLFSGKTVRGEELRGEINKVVELKWNLNMCFSLHLLHGFET